MSTSSRSVMFTGTHITNTNMIDNTDFAWQGAMDDSLTTVGDMMNEAGYYSALKGKGGFLYENNVHVPLIIVHPDYEGGKRVSAVTSHVDLAPTFVDMTNISAEKKAEITANLPGKSLLPLMDGSQESVRDAALFCFEMLSMTAVQYGKDAEGNTTYGFDVNARGMVRGITTDQYKFVRYFSPVDFNTPTTIEELFAHNDVQLFDLKADPDEMVNLAADPEANAELITRLNDLLNETIAREIGVDDGAYVMKVLKGLQEKIKAA